MSIAKACGQVFLAGKLLLDESSSTGSIRTINKTSALIICQRGGIKFLTPGAKFLNKHKKTNVFRIFTEIPRNE